MGWPGLVFGVVLALGTGWLLARALTHSLPPSPGGRAFRLGLAALLGLGLGSLTSFAWRLAGGSMGEGYVLFDLATLVFVGAAAVAFLRANRSSIPPAPPAGGGVDESARWSRFTARMLAAALAISLVLSIGLFIETTRRAPHGQWDAVAVWNLHARFLYRAGASWRDMFAPELGASQPGYPLLLPATVARLWAWGGESTFAPALVAGLFTFSPVLVLGGATAIAAGPAAGLGAALLLLGTPSWIRTGAAQYADLAAGDFLLCAQASLLVAGSRGSARAGSDSLARGLLGAGGIALGFAAWTKDEGLAMAAVSVAVWSVGWWRTQGSPVFRRLAWVGAGAAAPLLALLLFRVVLAPSTAQALTTGQTAAGVAAKLLDPDRHSVVWSALAREAPGAPFFLPVFAGAVAVLLGARPGRMLRSAPLLAAVAMVLVYAMVFLATPQPLLWHLGTSASRLLLQLWPTLLLGLFSATEEFRTRADPR